MKVLVVKLLVALSLIVTGLSFPLTILHASMIGFSTGQWVLSSSQFRAFIAGAGLLPWMYVSIVIYVVGMILLIRCGITSKKEKRDTNEIEM